MITRSRVLVLACFAAPLLLAYYFPWLSLGFSPRGIVYSNELAPVFFAPVAWPESSLVALSRLLQVLVLLCLDNPVKAIGFSWAGWILLAVLRTGTGFLLTRSVGWACPALFSHWALYETASGLGPALLAYLIIADPPFHATVARWSSHHWALPLAEFVFCWLECRPWTYGTALALAYLIAWMVQHSQTLLPKPVSEKPPGQPRKLSSTFVPTAAAILVPWFVLYHLIPPPRLPLPFGDRPLVDILMLSYPRPVSVDVSIGIINSSITSYLPYLSPAVSLSLFTHSTSHEALDHVIRSLDNKAIALHVDTDTHLTDHDNHYLHLAEAFRWVMEDVKHEGEWVMLVEDDFTVCGGDNGWSVITTVMNRLEADRQKGIIRSGFIGTGGSGIIIHRSYLPTLIFLLRTLSSIDSPLHPNFVRRLPDQIIHDCILGRQYSFCERRDADQSKLLISSRLVLDHIGGLATTTVGKPGNVDKWRCGWRHAFHGDKMVDVVVV